MGERIEEHFLLGKDKIKDFYGTTAIFQLGKNMAIIFKLKENEKIKVTVLQSKLLLLMRLSFCLGGEKY